MNPLKKRIAATDWLAAASHGRDRKSDQAETLPLDPVANRAPQSGASERTQRMADKVAKADPNLAKQVAMRRKTLSDGDSSDLICC
ncbi:hypothetical protein [Paraburkholderia adhaesiva]|uniref:hypothetical protein n=1 Tax=Paraburkholderia adhaesiva TaxID=2883244 RepID=UPI001F380C6A|nr:hypothetical protein [Paraburkholderia adhaesiva]